MSITAEEAALVDLAIQGKDRAYFGTLKVPSYKPVKVGAWKLEQQNAIIPLRGYFTGRQACFDNWILRRHNVIWMSITPMELESLALHALEAEGHTVIMGLGMGLVVYNAALNPNVERITVIEKSRQLIELFDFLQKDWDWPREKVKIVKADAKRWKPTEPADALMIDIWYRVGDKALEQDTFAIQRNVNARKVGAWGQEYALLDWMINNGEHIPITREHIAGWMRNTGIPWIGADRDDYGIACEVAVTQQILHSEELRKATKNG